VTNAGLEIIGTEVSFTNWPNTKIEELILRLGRLLSGPTLGVRPWQDNDAVASPTSHSGLHIAASTSMLSTFTTPIPDSADCAVRWSLERLNLAGRDT
jgi:hypothetical protein